MRKKVILRSLLGAPLGLFICTATTIIISLAIGDGIYYATVPEFNELFGNELTAVIVQTVAVLIYGAVWGGASVIWENEKWSLLKQTLLHLIICSTATYPIAYITYWMPHNAIGSIIYYLIFFLIYMFVWVSIYLSIRTKIKKVNQVLDEIK